MSGFMSSTTAMTVSYTHLLDVLPADCFIPREENPLNTEVRVRNADFIRSPYFQSLKTDALCVEPQSRKIVFKTAAVFGESEMCIRDRLRTALLISTQRKEENRREDVGALPPLPRKGHHAPCPSWR